MRALVAGCRHSNEQSFRLSWSELMRRRGGVRQSVTRELTHKHLFPTSVGHRRKEGRRPTQEARGLRQQTKRRAQRERSATLSSSAGRLLLHLAASYGGSKDVCVSAFTCALLLLVVPSLALSVLLECGCIRSLLLPLALSLSLSLTLRCRLPRLRSSEEGAV